MRYLKRYNENLDVNHQALAKIKEHFTKTKVEEMLNKERQEWSDDYLESNNGEAEEIIIQQIISWYNKEYKPLDKEEEVKLEDTLKQEFNLN